MSAQSHFSSSLIRGAKDGDACAMNSVLQRCEPFVYSVVRRQSRGQLRARMDSCDLVQEVLLRVTRGIGGFDGSDDVQLRGWMAQIARREVIRQLRRHVAAQRRAITRERPIIMRGNRFDATSAVVGDAWLPGREPPPSLAMRRKEDAGKLADALSRLPEDYRRVLELRHQHGMDFAAIARQMNRSSGSVRVLWVRALRKMRAMIGSVTEHGGSGIIPT